MPTVEEVLRKHGYQMSEDAVATNLAALLEPLGDSTGADLSAGDQEYLDRYSGVRPASGEELAALDARSAAQAVAEAAKTLSRQQVAARLGVDVTRVSHQTAARGLYSYRADGGRPVYPDWQFTRDGVIPHLGRVLAVIPTGAHPVTVRRFMVTPDDELVIDGDPVTPRRWLASGGDPETVAALAVTLGEQV